jgi:histidine triad (HIT) family protein
MTAYDPNNIFAKILRGEIPCHKIYENEKTFAFLDIMPRSPGHTLVIPKASARNILDVDPEDFAHVARTAKRIAMGAKQAFNADGITLQQFSEQAGGQAVFHLHVHIMPRTMGVALLPAMTHKEKPELLESNATRLIAALKG